MYWPSSTKPGWRRVVGGHAVLVASLARYSTAAPSRSIAKSATSPSSRCGCREEWDEAGYVATWSLADMPAAFRCMMPSPRR